MSYQPSYYGSIPSSGSGTAGSSATDPTLSDASVIPPLDESVLDAIRACYIENRLQLNRPDVEGALQVCTTLCQRPWLAGQLDPMRLVGATAMCISDLNTVLEITWGRIANYVLRPDWAIQKFKASG
jgi:hypothetical protein